MKCKVCLVEKDIAEFEPRRRQCKPCRNVLRKQQRSKQEVASRRVVYERNSLLKNRYNISLEEYSLMLVHQNNMCAICSDEPTDRRLSIDHDHNSGKFRGLLCMKCNLLLGQARDNIDILEAAIQYLKRNEVIE